MQEVMAEKKFTESTMLYRLKTSYSIKHFSAVLLEAKGFKAVKGISLYVNNASGIDLAEMRNNWAIW